MKKIFALSFYFAVIICAASSAAAGEKTPAHIKVLKGSASNEKAEQFTSGKTFNAGLNETITLNPITAIEISTRETAPAKIILRNQYVNKTMDLSISAYLKDQKKNRKKQAYQQLKNALLPRDYYYVCRFDGEIKIDGKLDEKAWKTAVPMPLFADLISGKAPRFAATCKALWDNENLYLAYRSEDPCIWARANTYDEQMYLGKGGNNGNFIKFFADPDCDGRDYIEIHVNPLNNVMDAWLPCNWEQKYRKELGIDDAKPSFLAIEWDCEGMKTAVDIQGTLNKFDDVDESWTVEMKIPFKSLKRFDRTLAKVPPGNNTKWLVHLCRRYRLSQNAPPEDTWYFAWPEAGIRSTHRSSKYGYFIFKNATWSKILSEIHKKLKEDDNE